MGSCRVGLGLTGIDAVSGWDGVVSGRGVEAEGPPVGGASGVDAGGEDGSGRAGSGTGSRRCSDGPASYPQLSYSKTNRISFSRFLHALVEGPDLGHHVAREPQGVEELPEDVVPLGALSLCSDSPFLRCHYACLRCYCASFRLFQSPVPVRHLGLKTVIVVDEPGDPGPERIHLPGLRERPDRQDDSFRSHP